MKWSRLAAAAALTLAAASARAQAPPADSEFPLNVTLAGDQADAAVAIEADGGYVVAWRSGSSIVARRLDAAGVPRSGELAVSLTPAAVPGRPTVATVPVGGFLVAWAGADVSGRGILARWFDASGQAHGGEIVVNAAMAGDQIDPEVAGGPFGYVMTWVSGGTSIVGRLLSGATGLPLGVEIPVGAGHSPAVAWRGNGIVFAWADASASGPVFTRIFAGTGVPAGPAMVANGPNPFMPPFGFGNFQRRSLGVSAAANGRFTVSWDLDAWSASGGVLPLPFWYVQFGSYVRRFDASGAPLADETRVNAYANGAQQQPSIGVAPGGTTFVAWTSAPVSEGCSGPTCFPPAPPAVPQDGSGSGVYGRLFDAGGADVGGGEFRVNVATAGDQRKPAVARSDAGMLAVFEAPDGSGSGLLARRFGYLLAPAGLEVDPTDEMFSDGNGVLENWEAVMAAPAWRNTGPAQAMTSVASAFTGPAGPSYEIVEGTADYGVIPSGATAGCRQTGDCFSLAVFGARPALHWDAQFTEIAQPGTLAAPRTRILHVGDSFGDVARTSPFYRFVETVFHGDVMPPCLPGSFCPAFDVVRETMAQFVLKAASPGFVPPACVAGSERFADVPATNPYCSWIEELARRGVVVGCGGGNYCPLAAVNRETMAVYLLLTKEGTGYRPPACTVPLFADVPASSPFCRWIEELAGRGIVAGCGNGNYCPFLSVAREQMSVFVTGTFGLLLYAP